MPFSTIQNFKMNSFWSCEIKQERAFALRQLQKNDLNGNSTQYRGKLKAFQSPLGQNYAEYLAANQIFEHSNAKGLGENLYMSYGMANNCAGQI